MVIQVGNKETIDEAFHERNMLALLFCRGYYEPEDGNGWKVLVLDTPAGQLTFHVPPDFPTYGKPELDPSEWDGHTTEEKWGRVKVQVRKDGEMDSRYWFIPCPVHQCGGAMKHVEIPPPKGSPDEYGDGWPGDEQRPNLVCDNCEAVYHFYDKDIGPLAHVWDIITDILQPEFVEKAEKQGIIEKLKMALVVLDDMPDKEKMRGDTTGQKNSK